MSELAFLGVGLYRPALLEAGKAVTVAGLPNLEQAIGDLLNTPLGTRYFNPDYGSRIYEVLFEPNDDILKSLLRQTIQEAIANWEKRVRFTSADFVIQSDLIEANITVEVLPSNEIKSFVFPFYRQLIY